MSMHETDLRRLQGREGIARAWKLYQLREIAKFDAAVTSMQRTRDRFNLALSETQNPKGEK